MPYMNIMVIKGGGQGDEQTQVLRLVRLSGLFSYCGWHGIVFSLCHTPICYDYVAGNRIYWLWNLYNYKKIAERGEFMKIVILKAPKFFRGILKSIFKMKSDE